MQTLEGLRGLAILLVFLCHYDLIILARLPIGPVLDRLGRVVRDVGGTGVDLFFVLSGFLIYRAVLKPNMKYNSFLVRRAQRIYPTFLAVLAMYITADVFLITRLHIGTEYHRIPQDFKHAIVYLLENVTFLPGLFPIQPIMNVAWSLSYECFFYLFLPIIIVTTGIASWRPKNRIMLFFLLAFIFVSLTLLMPDAFHASSNPIRRSHVKLIMFLAGMIVSDALQCGLEGPHRYVDISVFSFLMLFLGISSFTTLAEAQGQPSALAVRSDAIISASLFLAYGAMVYGALAKDGTLSRAFSFAPLRWLGNMSYSFYLLHGLPMHVLAIALAQSRVIALPHPLLLAIVWTFLPVTFAITVWASTLLFLTVEKPLSLNNGTRRTVGVDLRH
jgi:peptidoglycan/LPS O-acetylase OafA/YrhL